AMLTPKPESLPEFTHDQFLRLLRFEALAQECESEFPESFDAQLTSFVERVRVGGSTHSKEKWTPTQEYQEKLFQHLVSRAVDTVDKRSIGEWEGWIRAICGDLKWFH